MADESPVVEEQEPLHPPSTTLFPVTKQTPSAPINPLQLSNSTTPTWLTNTSFTADISTINDVVSSRHHHHTEPEPEQEPQTAEEQQTDERRRYELVDSSASDQDEDVDVDGRSSRKKEKRKRRKRKQRDYEYGSLSRKHKIQSWATDATGSNKEYYFDSRGDLDNLAFGSLYRYMFYC